MLTLIIFTMIFKNILFKNSNSNLEKKKNLHKNIYKVFLENKKQMAVEK